MLGLNRLIKKEIERNGAISFCDYMELCLYHPKFGYYTSEGMKIGKQGDYYTSAYLETAFGTLIAKRLV